MIFSRVSFMLSVAIALFLLLSGLSGANAATTCKPENFNKQFTMAFGEGSLKCYNELTVDTPCRTTCLTCYATCRGSNDLATFIVDDVGATLCLCSPAAALPSASFAVVVALVAGIFVTATN